MQIHDSGIRSTDPFENFFTENYKRVYAILYRIVGSAHEAEDLAVEVFHRAWTRKIYASEKGPAWLYRVALRRAWNSLRSTKRRIKREEASGMHIVGSASSDPHKLFEVQQAQETVRIALRKMKGRGADLLLLHHSGFSYKEIAAALRLNPNSIGTMLHRGEEEFEKLYHGENK